LASHSPLIGALSRESGDPTLALSPGGPLLAYSEWIFGSVSQCVFGRARERYSEILFKCLIFITFIRRVIAARVAVEQNRPFLYYYHKINPIQLECVHTGIDGIL